MIRLIESDDVPYNDLLGPGDSVSQTGSRGGSKGDSLADSQLSKVSHASLKEMEAGAKLAEIEAQLEVQREISKKKREVEELERIMQLKAAQARQDYFGKIARAEDNLLNVDAKNSCQHGENRSPQTASRKTHTSTTGRSVHETVERKVQFRIPKQAHTTNRSVDETVERKVELRYPKQASTTERSVDENVERKVESEDRKQVYEVPVDLLHNLSVRQKRGGLPKTKLEPFKGDITRFRSFMRSFKHLIADRTDDNEERLHFLEEFTAGTPQEIVRGCGLLPANEGYKSALNQLEKRYGKDQLMVSAQIDKIMEFPNIRGDDPHKRYYRYVCYFA